MRLSNTPKLKKARLPTETDKNRGDFGGCHYGEGGDGYPREVSRLTPVLLLQSSVNHAIFSLNELEPKTGCWEFVSVFGRWAMCGHSRRDSTPAGLR